MIYPAYPWGGVYSKSEVDTLLTGKSDTSHTHTSSDITDLPSGLTVDTTLDSTSSNAIANSAVSNALDGKSNTGHTHVKSEITDFPTIPSKTSDLTNDSNFITSAIKEGDFGNKMAGWCLLHGDLLLQWGSNTSTSRDFKINFSKPFSAVPTIVANYGDTVNYSTPCCVHSTQTTYFNAAHPNDGGWRVNWIAIGKKGY